MYRKQAALKELIQSVSALKLLEYRTQVSSATPCRHMGTQTNRDKMDVQAWRMRLHSRRAVPESTKAIHNGTAKYLNIPQTAALHENGPVWTWGCRSTALTHSWLNAGARTAKIHDLQANRRLCNIAMQAFNLAPTISWDKQV